jgi:Uma2 family endonuclease
MRTLVLDPPSVGLDELLERRERLGLDHYDEVWEGVLHMNPPPTGEHQYVLEQLAELLGPLARRAGLIPLIREFGLGDNRDNYRVPDGGLHREQPRGVWHPTAALVIEVVSPDDESWEKLPFYAAHKVDEVMIVDPTKRSIDWLELKGEKYEETQRSALIDLGPQQLAGQIDWPPLDKS